MQLNSVVIIDDERLLCTSIQGILSAAGCEAHAFQAPGDALDFIAANHCDLMITDLKMPEMDGLALIEQARAACPLIRTILMSAFLNQVDRDLAAFHEVDLVLEKPVDLDLLISQTNYLLSTPNMARI
ncbi:MAG: response regulator [Bacteroidota bacterium]